MPAKPADLVAAGARVEAQVVDLQRLHAQGTFGKFIAAGIHNIHDDFDRSLSRDKIFSSKNTKTLLLTHLLRKLHSHSIGFDVGSGCLNRVGVDFVLAVSLLGDELNKLYTQKPVAKRLLTVVWVVLEFLFSQTKLESRL